MPRLPVITLIAALSSLPVVRSAEVIRMLVPGFTVQELPVRLSNQNNLRFAPDGRLTTLGYDGRIHLLRDSNGDGLEDEVTVFWDKPTLSVPVGMVWGSDGLYVSSKGKVSRLRDTDGDGRADVEEVIASGWPPTDVASGGVDATAVTRDAEGNLFFGLLVADYSNPYRIKDGVSHYDLRSPRGTIQKWNARTRQLETMATGVRVPYALAFNRHGDLFLTDQEGETWCPNGNPLDELNHIIPGRNYGFPPRHDRWLPDLLSEPPVVGFGPQHQSTCGLVFNDPEPASAVSPGRKPFGPDWWEGDAFVAGESRGKIWRVRLVKTRHGYVGKEMLIARLSMLTMDVAISPRGELYVCCHSGLPDWGTGPSGEGKIFKITYSDRDAPQPVAAWAAWKDEVRVAFDRAIDPSITNHLALQKIEFGEHVRAADRYELLKPPYQVVKQQEVAARGTLRVLSAQVDPQQQTLILTTEPHLKKVHYAVTLPGVKKNGTPGPGAIVDLDYDLSGVLLKRITTNVRFTIQATNELDEIRKWTAFADKAREAAFAGKAGLEWMPSPDLVVSKKLMQPLTHFSRVVDSISSGAWFALADCYWESPFTHDGFRTLASVYAGGSNIQQIGSYGSWSGHKDGFIGEDLAYSARGIPGLHPFPLRSVFPTWVLSLDSAPKETVAWQQFELNGGDYARGQSLFFGDSLKCGTCHRLRGEGGTIGPDLTNLTSRDAASVLRDIREPNASINPDYTTYHALAADGEWVTGFIRAQDENVLRLVAADGQEHAIPRKDLREFKPSSVSLMPTGLLDSLNEGQIRDLLVYLLSAPPKRTRADVETVVKAAQALAAKSPDGAIGDAQSIILVASKQDHGPGEHDYPAWQKSWRDWLGRATGVSVQEAWEWPSDEQFAKAGAILFYFWNHNWSVERLRQLDQFLERGGAVVLLHAATIADKDPEQLAERIGLAAQPGRTGYLHTPFELKFPHRNHPITMGFPETLALLDEPYWPMIGDTNKVEVLATVSMEGKNHPMVWVHQKGRGRVFASIAGHYTWTLDDPLFRLLVLRGLAWAMQSQTDRFDAFLLESTAKHAEAK
jgi:putative heme-binding domain-containing protein